MQRHILLVRCVSTCFRLPWAAELILLFSSRPSPRRQTRVHRFSASTFLQPRRPFRERLLLITWNGKMRDFKECFIKCFTVFASQSGLCCSSFKRAAAFSWNWRVRCGYVRSSDVQCICCHPKWQGLSPTGWLLMNAQFQNLLVLQRDKLQIAKHGFSRFYSPNPSTAVPLSSHANAHFCPVKYAGFKHCATGEILSLDTGYQAAITSEAVAHEIVVASPYQLLPVAVVWFKRRTEYNAQSTLLASLN